MTSSRSNSRIASVAVAVVLWTLAIGVDVADAAPRKRVVVLEFEGPKAAKFHDDVEKLVRRTHTVVPLDKWNQTAEDLDAENLSAKNVKRVAKKLKVDAIISGKIEKRRDEYLVKVKLRSGKSGEHVGDGVNTKSGGPRLDASASRDLKDELIAAIDDLGSNRGGGKDKDEDDNEQDEARPAKKKPARVPEDDEEDEAKPSRKNPKDKAEDEADVEDEAEDEKPVKKGFSRRDDEDEDEPSRNKPENEGDEQDVPKVVKTRPAKADEDEDEDEDADTKIARKSEDDDDENAEDEAEGETMASSVALSPAERAVDVAAGLSLNARRLGFAFDGDLITNKPTGYKGVPVAGLLLDATVFPLAISHKRTDMLKNIGVTAMYDKVLFISSKSMTTNESLPTSQARWALGAVFRYPLGTGATAPVVGAALRFGRQSFTITGMADVPNVAYTIIDPSVSFRYPVVSKIILNASLGFMFITSTGAIQDPDQYGAATVSGYEGELGGDYLFTKNLFARASFRFEAISFEFKGTGVKTNRDDDPEQDVQGAKDNYFGGTLTVGYLY